MKRIALLLLLTGCAAAPTFPSLQEVDLALNQTFGGRPLTAMLTRYGSPDGRQMLSGMEVYTWRTLHTVNWSSGPETYTCKIDAYVRPDGVTVDGVVMTGQQGACWRFKP